MRFVIDGNNVMGSAHARLIAALAPLATKVPTLVVFDGAPPPDIPDGALRQGVRVRFAHAGRIADDRIVAIVEADPEPSEVTVITSDRALAARVVRLGARTASSEALRAKLDGRAAPARRRPAVRSAHFAPAPRARPVSATPYRMDAAYARGDWIEHPLFGLGPVVERGDTTIHVRFRSGTKRLAHAGGAPARAPPPKPAVSAEWATRRAPRAPPAGAPAPRPPRARAPR